MNRTKVLVLAALFYPLAMMVVTAGLLAFTMLVFKVELQLVSLVVLWFVSFGATVFLAISKRVLKLFGFYRYYSLMLVVIWALAFLQSAILLFSPSPG